MATERIYQLLENFVLITTHWPYGHSGSSAQIFICNPITLVLLAREQCLMVIRTPKKTFKMNAGK